MNSKKEPLIKYDDWTDYILRRISGPIASLISKYKIFPNSITLFRSVLMLFIMYLFFKAKVISIFVGGILLQIYDILDYVDGDLARFTNRVSIFGEWLEYFENNLQGNIGSLLGFFIVLGLFNKTGSIFLWIVLFFLCFGMHMKKILIITPIKSQDWIFNIIEHSSLMEFNKEINSHPCLKIGRIILWVSTRDINVIFLASIILPLLYRYIGLSPLCLALIIIAIAHNLVWLGIAYYQLKFIIKNK